jgi:hypothetical protein
VTWGDGVTDHFTQRDQCLGVGWPVFGGHWLVLGGWLRCIASSRVELEEEPMRGFIPRLAHAVYLAILRRQRYTMMFQEHEAELRDSRRPPKLNRGPRIESVL